MCCTGFCCFIQASICVSQTFFFLLHSFNLHSWCLDGFFMLLLSHSLGFCILPVSFFASSFFRARNKIQSWRNVCNAHVLLATIYKRKNCLQKTIQNICWSRTCALLSLHSTFSLSLPLSFQSISFARCCIALKRKKNIIITN